MAIPKWVESHLEGVPHEYHKHKPVFTAQELAQEEGVTGFEVAKVVVGVNDQEPILFVMPAPYRLNVEGTRKILKAPHLRLANETEIKQFFPDCEVGAVPPLPQWDGVDVWVESEGFVRDKILFQAGNHEECVVLNFNDWYEKTQPKLAHFSRSLESERKENRMSFVMRAIGASAILMMLGLYGIIAYYVLQYTFMMGDSLWPTGLGLFATTIMTGGLLLLSLACLVAIFSIVLYPIVAMLAYFIKGGTI